MEEQFVCDSAETANKYILDQGSWLPKAKSLWSDLNSVWEDPSLKEIRDDLKKFLTLFLKLVNSNSEHNDTRDADEQYAREFLDNTCSLMEADAHACAMGFINYQSKREPIGKFGIRLWLSDNEGDRERARIFSLVEYKLLAIDQNGNKQVTKYSIDVQYTPVVARRLRHFDGKNDPQLIEHIQRIDHTIEIENYQLSKLKTWSSQAEGYRITYTRITGESGLILNMSCQGLNLKDEALNVKYQDTLVLSDFATFSIELFLPFLSQEFYTNMKINERKSFRKDTDTNTKDNACGRIHIPSSDPAAPGDKSRGSDQILFYELFYELVHEDDENYFVNLIICGIFASKVRRGQLTESEALLETNTPWFKEEEPLFNWIKSINVQKNQHTRIKSQSSASSPESAEFFRELASNYSLRIVPESSTAGKWAISYNKSNYKPMLDPRCCQDHEKSGNYHLQMIVNPNEAQVFDIKNEIKIGTCERLNLFDNCEIESTIIANVSKLNWSPLQESSRQLLRWQSQLANEVNNSQEASLMELFRIGILTASDIVVNSLRGKILGCIQSDDQSKDFYKLWPFNLSKLNQIVEDFSDTFLDHLDKSSPDKNNMVKLKSKIAELLVKDAEWVSSLNTPVNDKDKHKNIHYYFLASILSLKNLSNNVKKRELNNLNNYITKLKTNTLIPYFVYLSHIALVIIDDTRKHNPFANLLLHYTPDILTQHMCQVVGGEDGPHCEMVLFSLLRINLDIPHNKIQSIGISKKSCALCSHIFASFGFENYRSGNGEIFNDWKVLKWMVEGDNLDLFLGKNNPDQENYRELLKVYNYLLTKTVNLPDRKWVLRGSEIALVLISMLGSFNNDVKNPPKSSKK